MAELDLDYDTDLTDREVERMSPQVKAKRSKLALTRKIERLEFLSTRPSLLRDFVEREHFPWKRPNGEKKRPAPEEWKRPGLRTWKDAERKLWSWKFDKVDDPNGKNDDLMRRFAAVLKVIAGVLQGTISDKEFVDQTVEIEALRARIAALEKQNIDLLSQILLLQKYAPHEMVRR
jgi:hypothetical protein